MVRFIRRRVLPRVIKHHSRSRRGFELIGEAYERLVYPKSRLREVNIDRPIFIIGSPRSGTTVFYKFFRVHPSLVYATQASDLFPTCPIFANKVFRLLNANESSEVVEHVKASWALQWKREGFNYAEGYWLWNHFDEDQPRFCLTEGDVTPEEKDFYRSFVQKHLLYAGAQRFVNKAPINSLRMGYLSEIFPGATFIHLLRDGRAVASSILDKRQKIGGKWWGPKPPSLQDVAGLDLIVQGALQWKYLVQGIQSCGLQLELDRYLAIRYEDFIQAPLSILRQAFDFCGLDPAPADLCKDYRLSDSAISKWMRNLDEAQVAAVEDAIGDILEDLGYKVGKAALTASSNSLEG